MNTKQRSILQSMMHPYQGKAHAVAAFGLSHGPVDFISAGRQIAGTPSADWIFEIGSITKVFTAILLCLLEEEGQVDPRAPLREMSDLLADVPDHITPERLSAHVSGLPRLHVPVWKALIHPLPADPYAAFSRADLLDWLHHWRGTAPGAKPRHRYSNLGMGLLGEAMALRMNTPFVDLLANKVLMPLGMGDTGAQLDPDQQPRFAAPHNTKGQPVPAWSFQAMAAAGCLRSSPRDLARFSQQVIRAVNAPETTLDRAICRSTQPIFGLSPGGRSAMRGLDVDAARSGTAGLCPS